MLCRRISSVCVSKLIYLMAQNGRHPSTQQCLHFVLSYAEWHTAHTVLRRLLVRRVCTIHFAASFMLSHRTHTARPGPACTESRVPLCVTRTTKTANEFASNGLLAVHRRTKLCVRIDHISGKTRIRRDGGECLGGR